jgi:hypothetical protein
MYALPPDYKSSNAYELEQLETLWQGFKDHLVKHTIDDLNMINVVEGTKKFKNIKNKTNGKL